METVGLRKTLGLVFLITCSWPSSVHSQGEIKNCAPALSIVWPREGDGFSGLTLIKIKANATDPDGFIEQVRFFAGTNLIGVVTNPPFNIIWEVRVPGALYGMLHLKAIAVDNLGATTESAPVTVFYYLDPPPAPVLQIVSPRNGALIAAPATFEIRAELLASLGDTGPVEFFVGTNSAGLVDQGGIFSATTPPNSITLSNLLEGEYKLMVRYRGGNGLWCPCNWRTNTIRVVKLGVQLPNLTQAGRFQFEVLTSFPGRQTIIQASSNLGNWVSLSSNYPSSNSFTFTEATPATNAQRFYRVLVPSEPP